MKIKLDENLSRHLKAALTSAGHQASTAADEDLLGKPDADVAAAAKAERMMVFTLDVGFADIRRFPPGTHSGIVLFRPVTLGPLAVNRFVLDFVRDQNLESLALQALAIQPLHSV
jgi:predicted nuclease of predicted toxin-antitoxin system